MCDLDKKDQTTRGGEITGGTGYPERGTQSSYSPRRKQRVGIGAVTHQKGGLSGCVGGGHKKGVRKKVPHEIEGG